MRKRIYEPFFTTKKEKGTGLGLWVVKIISKHEGSLRLRTRTQPGRSGTVVSVFLPAENWPGIVTMDQVNTEAKDVA